MKLKDKKGKFVKTGITKKCKECSKPFYLPKSREDRLFCSSKCMGINKEFRNDVSKRMKGKYIGNKSPKWKGNLISENERARKNFQNILWRKSVMQRDNWTCQKTGKRGGNLVAHHINNFADFPELRFAIDNGITLLESEHIKFHKIYGKRNNTREQLLDYLNNKND